MVLLHQMAALSPLKAEALAAQPSIEFIDLKAQQARIACAIDAAVAGALDHGQYVMGPEVSELEERLATYAEPSTRFLAEAEPMLS